MPSSGSRARPAPWGTTSYSYDAAGNMVQKQNSSSSTTTKYTYNSMDELVRSSTASGAATYSYNGDGDLVVKNDGTNVWTYVYNAQDQMTKVLENGVVVQQNYYDGEGRRVEQVTGGATTLYLYAGLNVLYEKNLQTGVATKHVYADGHAGGGDHHGGDVLPLTRTSSAARGS